MSCIAMRPRKVVQKHFDRLEVRVPSDVEVTDVTKYYRGSLSAAGLSPARVQNGDRHMAMNEKECFSRDGSMIPLITSGT